MRISPSSRSMWSAVLVALLLGLAGRVPAADAQSSPAPEPPEAPEPPSADVLDDLDALDDLDRQIDSSSGPNTELWEEYQRFRQDGDPSDPRRRSTERVEIGGSIVIREDEYIQGDVVAVGGRVTVYGHVQGDCVAVGGDVILADGAVVEGDAVSVGGRVEQSGDAEVLGERVSIDIGLNFGNWFGGGDHEIGVLDFQRPGWLGISLDIAFLIAALLISLLLYALAGKRLDVVSRRIDEEPGQSFLIGLLSACATPFALLVTSLLLIVTIIGTLLIPVLVILVVVMAAAGFVAVALTVGRRISSSRSGDDLQPSRGPYFFILIGFVALYALDLVSTILAAIGGPVMPFALLFGVLGGFVLIFASILGYGALVVSRFGTQPAVAGAAAPGYPAAPLPPPPPPAGPPPPPSAGPPPAPGAPDAPPTGEPRTGDPPPDDRSGRPA